SGSGAPQVAGPDVSQSSVRWRSFTGKAYSGSGFRFRAIGGFYRVVVRGAGVYLFAGGHGAVWLRGSSHYPNADGFYSLGGRPFRSLPAPELERSAGGGRWPSTPRRCSSSRTSRRSRRLSPPTCARTASR